MSDIEQLVKKLKSGVSNNRLIETIGGCQHYVSNLEAAQALTELQERIDELESQNKKYPEGLTPG